MAAKYPKATIAVLPDSIKTMPTTCQWIWETFGHERFVFIDDDIQWIKRRKVVDGKYIPEDIEDQSIEIFAELEKLLDAGAAVAAPAPNWMHPNQSSWPIAHASRCVQFRMIDGPKLRDLGIRWDRLEAVEDDDFIMQVLAAGFDTVQKNDIFFYTFPMGANSGGMAVDQARAEKTHRARLELCKLWDGFYTPSKRTPGKFMAYRARLLKQSQKITDGTSEPTEVTEAPKRRRGRPPKTDKSGDTGFTISFTASEMQRLMIKADHMKIGDWAKHLLLSLIEADDE